MKATLVSLRLTDEQMVFAHATVAAMRPGGATPRPTAP